MNEAIKQSLRQAQEMIRSGDLNGASEILEPLKQTYPELTDVAQLWCAMMMRAGRSGEVLPYAAKIFSLAEGDLQ
ncbi:MAG TPA: cytidyltransferase, partial [Nitrosomonas sp.]|nr:cytidyltransferase [Nitrosomonas sp.]